MNSKTYQRAAEAWQFELTLGDALRDEGRIPEAIEAYLRVLTIVELQEGGATKASPVLLNAIGGLLDKLDFLKGFANTRERACRFMQDRLHERYNTAAAIRQILSANNLPAAAPQSTEGDTTADA